MHFGIIIIKIAINKQIITINENNIIFIFSNNNILSILIIYLMPN